MLADDRFALTFEAYAAAMGMTKGRKPSSLEWQWASLWWHHASDLSMPVVEHVFALPRRNKQGLQAMTFSQNGHICAIIWGNKYKAPAVLLTPDGASDHERLRLSMAISDRTPNQSTDQPPRDNSYQKIACLCPVCGKEFLLSPVYVKRSNYNCCSFKCRGVITAQKAADKRTLRDCGHCGKSFSVPKSHVDRNQVYCSKDCRTAANPSTARAPAICPSCGETFVKTYRNQKYCCLKCRPAHNKKDKVEHTCLTCGKNFMVKQATHDYGEGKYCSRRCFGAGKVKHMGGKLYSRSKGGKRADLNNMYFRSAWEANYARYLNWLVANGEIRGWEYEPKTFVFEAIRHGSVTYTPDFKVIELDGSYKWHEVKGWMDDKSKTKLKRMAKYFPGETIVLIDEPAYRSLRQWAGLIDNWEYPVGSRPW